jgi:hypothetical protein
MNASDIQASPEVRERNRRSNRRNLPDECFICGRGMAQDAIERGSSIHLLTDGTLALVGDMDNPLSQGWFPVGSECARKVPAEFRW